ncbi:MAG: IS630 family transposase, partial [Acidobacteria bacterium]
EAAIAEFIAIHNPQPKPFVWTKSADDLLNSIGRFASRTLTEHGANNI